MKPKKDIFDQFRDNQHKLNEVPSPQAWDRLEMRLDKHEDRKPKPIYRVLSMAAAVAVLVAVMSVITFVLNSNGDSMAMNEAVSKNFKVEELKVLTVSNENDAQIAAYQRKYNNHLSSPIQEGKANKKLIAKMDIQRRDGNLNSFIAKAKKEKEQSLTIVPATEPKIETAQTKVENYDFAKNEIPTADEEIAYESESKEEILQDVFAEDAKAFADGATMEAEDIDLAVKDEAAKKTKKYATKEIAAEKRVRASAAKELSAPEPTAGINNLGNSGIQQFQWLIGKWEGNINNQVSIEQWEKVNNKTLEGNGLVMANGLSVFNENMKIQEIDNVIYFIADLNGTGTPVRYQLVSNDGFKAIFENRNVEFPNQVVLQRTNSSNFSTIYQNTQPGNISETQQNYYMNRNFIQKEQAIRNLRRVND